jgi:hypothetical protein
MTQATESDEQPAIAQRRLELMDLWLNMVLEQTQTTTTEGLKFLGLLCLGGTATGLGYLGATKSAPPLVVVGISLFFIAGLLLAVGYYVVQRFSSLALQKIMAARAAFGLQPDCATWQAQLEKLMGMKESRWVQRIALGIIALVALAGALMMVGVMQQVSAGPTATRHDAPDSSVQLQLAPRISITPPTPSAEVQSK